MKTDVRTIADITNSHYTGNPDLEVKELFIDSRRVSALPDGLMFVALRGEKNDGHIYIPDLYRAGVRLFLVTAKYCQIDTDDYPDASFIITDDSLSALHKIAGRKRTDYGGRLIAITGSNGKTIIKEWLSELLGRYENVLRSPRSYNSQVGVPLSLWYLNDEYSTAVIEAGMSQPGEISRLEKMIKPQIGIFSHIGEAHQENFSSLNQKIHEKLSLFINSEVIIYPADKKEINEAILKDSRLTGKSLYRWSADRNSEAEVIIIPDLQNKSGPALKVISSEGEFICPIPFTDRASIDNISTVITALLCLGMDKLMISEGVKDLYPVAMRMEQKEGINSCLLLEDFYNSDPGSLKIALEYLKGLSEKNMTLILSDFVQGNRDRERLYREVAGYAAQIGVSKLIAIGDDIVTYGSFFNVPDKAFFRDTDQFISSFDPGNFRNEAVLLKGARKYEFERIGSLLELKTHQTRLMINLNAVLFNLNTFRSYLDRDTRVMAMVKAFAYGTGSKEVSEWLVYNGIDYLAVAYPDEGINLRKEGVKCRIMVMNPDPYSLRTLIEYDLEPEIYSLDIMRYFIKEAKRYGVRDYPVHLKLDTGMHRLGFTNREIDELVKLLPGSRSIRIASVFSHLAAAYDEDKDKYTHAQAAAFVQMSDYLRKETGSDFIRHMLNSAGIVRFPEYQFDMVRLGIGLYGITEVAMRGLRTGPGFYTKVSQVKNIEAGEGLGYGLEDAVNERRKIAILPVGYADGFRRLMGRGRGRVYAGGKHLPVIGNVCMDMCMIDISGTDIEPGDEVEIFGENISINEVAAVCNTIPYEILSGIPARVKRIFIYE